MTFTSILNLSISAAWLTLAVLLARLILRRAPKALHCALWGLVALRLLLPVSLESPLSLQPSREVISQDYLTMEPRDEGFSEPATLDIITNPIYDAPLSIEIEPTADRLQSLDLLSTVLWLTGMGAMAIYAAYSYIDLRLRVRMAAWCSGNVWECDNLDSPFILGLLRPRIYLPPELDAGTREHVLAHERAHLSRLDHIWKPLGFFLLSVHWFNPLLWLAYVLLCRDIELACDEKVVKKLGRAEVVEYSNALIRCAVPHRAIALCPLAFGEGGVKNRIRAILNYKKPGFWVLLLAAILCVALAVGFLTDPVGESTPVETAPVEQPIDAVLREDGFSVTETVERELDIMFYTHWLPEACFSPEGYRFDEGELTLYETGTTFLDLTQVIPVEDQLRFDFRFRYHVPENGTVLLPCFVNIKGVLYEMRLSGRIHDYSRDYYSGVQLQQQKDTMEFSLFFDRSLVENADDYLMVGLDRLYETTYIPSGLDIQDMELHVAEPLYQDGEYTITGSAIYAPTYIVERTMHLMALESCTRWDIRRDMGELIPVELTEENFDHLFRMDFHAEKLRKSATRAWYCQEQELSHILLQQSDGELCLAVLREDENLICDLYRLEKGASTYRAPEVMRSTFTFAEPDVFDQPAFTLSTDGTFTLRESMVSSYYGYGRYVIEEDSLVMKTDDGRNTWVFLPEGTGFRFDAAHSSPIAYLRTPRELIPVPDGALFGSNTPYIQSAPTLDVILNKAILEHNHRDEDEGLICVENHEVLGELIACGAAAVDGAPVEILTVYVAGEYRTFQAKGDQVGFKRFQRFCAAITLESTGNGYSVTEYHQTSSQNADAEAIFPDHILELYDERFAIIRNWSHYENAYDAQLLLFRAQGLETDIDALIETICSSPAQSSNPGDYIAAHPEEFDRLVALRTHTLRYCFAKFAQGDQIGLEGHIMALCCREIIPGRSDAHVIPYETCLTGQDWFDQFAVIAQQHREEMRLLDFEKQHPMCFLALQALGI